MGTILSYLSIVNRPDQIVRKREITSIWTQFVTFHFHKSPKVILFCDRQLFNVNISNNKRNARKSRKTNGMQLQLNFKPKLANEQCTKLTQIQNPTKFKVQSSFEKVIASIISEKVAFITFVHWMYFVAKPNHLYGITNTMIFTLV